MTTELRAVHLNPVHNINVADATLFNCLGTLKTHAQVLARLEQCILAIHLTHLALVVFPQFLEGRGRRRGRRERCGHWDSSYVLLGMSGACNGMVIATSPWATNSACIHHAF